MIRITAQQRHRGLWGGVRTANSTITTRSWMPMSATCRSTRTKWLPLLRGIPVVAHISVITTSTRACISRYKSGAHVSCAHNKKADTDLIPYRLFALRSKQKVLPCAGPWSCIMRQGPRWQEAQSMPKYRRISPRQTARGSVTEAPHLCCC